LYGRGVRQQYREQRANGEVVHVEVEPGIVIVVAAWMLSAAICARMELGAPRVSLDALDELHLLLSQQGLRRSCAGVCHTREELLGAMPLTLTVTPSPTPRVHLIPPYRL
jgi:hypothetical protein